MNGPTRFQQATVDHVESRMWARDDPARRFLVADEVGLGKTIVARELVKRCLARFHADCDIVYLCPSQVIASQNLKRIRLDGIDEVPATRLTLLAVETSARAAGDTRRVRYFAITPETSFNVLARSGHVRERALVFAFLDGVVQVPGLEALLRIVKASTWDAARDWVARRHPDRAIRDVFRRSVLDDPLCLLELRAVAAMGPGSTDHRKRRAAIVGSLREKLAFASVDAVARRGLVVVDEFQRFHQLMRPVTGKSGVATRLAARLLDGAGSLRRVLLLSATPYRPGRAGASPHGDFVELVRYLAGDARGTALDRALSSYTRALRAPVRDERAIIAHRELAQGVLRSVMSRTERTGHTKGADSMVVDEFEALEIEPGDLTGAVVARRLARGLGVHDTAEYWKSAPYFFDFMKGYAMRKVADARSPDEKARLRRVATKAGLLLDPLVLRSLSALKPPNARMRRLLESAIPKRAERLLWIPPSLPYFAGGHDRVEFRGLKRLVFSEWRLAPDAIAATASYVAEQRLDAASRIGGRVPAATPKRGRRHEAFGKNGEQLRLSGSDAVLALLLPIRLNPQIFDPLALALAERAPVSLAGALRAARKEVSRRIKSLPARRGGRPDMRWYWAAPVLICDNRLALMAWLGAKDPFGFATEPAPSPDARLAEGVLDALLASGLGAMPNDLVDVVAKLALAGPGACALRALSRSFEVADEPEVLRAAFRIARGFQSLFNQSEAAVAVRLETPTSRSYWRQALDYCCGGNLQALLDEQLHLAADAAAQMPGAPVGKAWKAACKLHDAMTLRRAQIEIGGLGEGPRRARRRYEVKMRCRHALRFAEIKETGGAVSRLDSVRDAFNSPFRPFVLASTTVGQEGLDFHLWCHAVVHWNLPRSPVELEQREGRVHRYKAHAVRLNVADGVGLVGLGDAGVAARSDPWAEMFRLAAAADPDGMLSPFWLFEKCPSPVRIRRIVPVLELSREADAWKDLKASLGVYRLALGLPRQADLVSALVDAGVTAEEAQRWRIDLSPGDH